MVEKKPESYFEQKVEDGVRIEDGYNDHVYDTGDTIIEYYPWISSTAPRQSLTELFLGKFRVYTRKRRMKNELNGAEFIDRIGLNSSEPVSRGSKFIEFEKIEGEDITGFDMEKMGQEVGEFMDRLHSENAALMDGNLSNFLYSEDKELYSIDHDSFRQDANAREIKFDLINTLTSVIIETPEEYSKFKNGIEKGYGELTREDELLLGVNTLLFNLISHDLRFLKNSFTNYREHHI